ncbi:hypothetical protein NPIL_392061, partial [Nephila pilipes]
MERATQHLYMTSAARDK